MTAIIPSGEDRIQYFLLIYGRFSMVRAELKTYLSSLDPKEFGDTVVPFLGDLRPEMDEKVVESFSEFRRLAKEVIHERNICEICLRGVMSGSGSRGRGYYHTETCSNCKSQVDVSN